MTSSFGNITQVKLDIKQIIDNLKQLEEYGPEANLEEFKAHTEYLLKRLENLPLEGLKAKLKKRQRKRRNRKLKKIKNLENDNILNTAINNHSTIGVITSSISREPKLKTPHLLKSVKECQRCLQTFELLEQLHLVRGENSSETYKFSLKLRQLKSIWNSLLQDKLQEQTSTDVKIQQQWNEVLFGPPEKTYFQDKPDLQDFIKKRQIWDSYIDSKYGTSIPIGWIFPNAEIKEKWQPYLATAYD